MPSFEFRGSLFGSAGYLFSSYVVKYMIADNGSDTFYQGSIVYDMEKDKTSPRNANMFSEFGIADCTFNKLDGYLYAISAYSGLYKPTRKRVSSDLATGKR